jgi:ABC-type nitrate/sulfonate/bicarbonate transport system substrate-binding protein
MRQKPLHPILTCHLLAVGLFILLLVAASEVRAQEKIRIGLSTHSPGFLPTVIAEKKGFYAKYGLVPEHIQISISVGMSALGTGDLDYSNGLAQGVLASIRGVPVKLVMFTQEKLVFFLVAKPQLQKVTAIGISYSEVPPIWWPRESCATMVWCRGKTSMCCPAETIKEGWPRSM